MDAVVYRTATRLRHHQHRVVCQVPVFAKSASASENSLISPSRSLSVEKNYGYQDPFGPTQVRSHQPGFARIDINKHINGCGLVWTNHTESAPSMGTKALHDNLAWTARLGLPHLARSSHGIGAETSRRGPPGHQQPRQRSRREYPCEHERWARRPRRQETRSSPPNSGIAVSSTLQSCAGSTRGPALPRLRESRGARWLPNPRRLASTRGCPSRSGAVTGAYAGVAAVDGWP